MKVFFLLMQCILGVCKPIGVYDDYRQCWEKAALKNQEWWGGNNYCKEFKEVQNNDDANTLEILRIPPPQGEDCNKRDCGIMRDSRRDGTFIAGRQKWRDS